MSELFAVIYWLVAKFSFLFGSRLTRHKSESARQQEHSSNMNTNRRVFSSAVGVLELAASVRSVGFDRTDRGSVEVVVLLVPWVAHIGSVLSWIRLCLF